MKTLKLLFVFGLILAMLSMVVGAVETDFVPSPEQSGSSDVTSGQDVAS